MRSSIRRTAIVLALSAVLGWLWDLLQYTRGRMYRGGGIAQVEPVPAGAPSYTGPWEAVPGGWVLRGGGGA